MFVARATFEIEVSESRPQTRVRLTAVEDVREAERVPDGQFATYSEIIRTLTIIAPDWALMAEQMPEFRRQYHLVRFARRDEITDLLTALNT